MLQSGWYWFSNTQISFGTRRSSKASTASSSGQSGSNSPALLPAGLGVAIGDYNRDGRMDVFKTNFAGDTSTLYANKPQSDLAEKLASIAPGNLKKSFFTSSGR